MQNKNALLRYRTIDRCLRNTGRRWTLEDLVEACSDALYDYEGKPNPVSTRTVQLDIQMMRSDRLGYEAPIEVYQRKYYRYSDPDYSISNRPLSQHDVVVLNRTIDLLRQYDEFDRFHDMADVVNRLQDKVATAENRRPIVDFERNPNLKGLQHLNPLYDLIAARRTVCFEYQSFSSRQPRFFTLYPYLLKEYRNRWFVFGSKVGNMKLFNLALDRIVSFRECPEIPYRDNPDFGPDFFDDVVGVTKHDALRKAKVVIKTFGSQGQYIHTKPIHASQRLVASDPHADTMTFELDVWVNWELTSLLMGFGDGVRVISPKWLADEIADNFRRCADRYIKV